MTGAENWVVFAVGFGVVSLALLACSVYCVKVALDDGATATWIVVWFIAILTFFGIFVVGTYLVIQGENRDRRHRKAAEAAVFIFFFPLAPLGALAFAWEQSRREPTE